MTQGIQSLYKFQEKTINVKRGIINLTPGFPQGQTPSMCNHAPTHKGCATESVTLWGLSPSSPTISSFLPTSKKQEIPGSPAVREASAQYLHQRFPQRVSQPLANNVYLFYPEADLLTRHSKNTNVLLRLEELQYWCLAAERWCRNIKWAMWMLNPPRKPSSETVTAENQPFGKAEGKPPAGRLWDEGRKRKPGDARKAHPMGTRGQFLRQLPPSSQHQKGLYLLSLDWMRKARQC